MNQLSLLTNEETDRITNLIGNSSPIFARHETFHPRFGWIKKGFDSANKNSGVFLNDEATVILGVGKNMVNAISYWCKAFKVLEENEPTNLGNRLLSNNGWDPFLEDPASLWLLHWYLLKPPCYATAWYYVFNQFRQLEFTQDELFNGLSKYRELLNKSNLAESSLRKDISCIIRMYVPEINSKKSISEESIDCPFTELGIIQTIGDAKHYSFKVGHQRNLPPEIVVFACLDFVDSLGSGQKTIAVSALLYNDRSPGMVFKLTESVLCDMIEQVSLKYDSIALSESAGLIQFSFKSSPKKLADNILDSYYQRRHQ